MAGSRGGLTPCRSMAALVFVVGGGIISFYDENDIS